jgi:integrase/recombinase XerD
MIKTSDGKFKSDFDNIGEIKEFTETLRLDKSNHTIINYLTSLDKFLIYSNILSFDDIKNLKNGDFIDFETKLKNEDHLQNSSINANMRPLKVFFNWLVEHEYIEKTPMKIIKRLKENYKERAYFTSDEITKFLLSCKNIEETFLFNLLFSTALRREEVCQLKLNDIDGDEVTIVHGKGKKTRKVYMPEYVCNLYKDYLIYRTKRINKYIKKGAENTDFIFISSRSKKNYSGRSILRMFKSIMVRAGFSDERIKEMHVHSCRHSAVAELIEDGVDLKIIQKICGHSNMSTTSDIYSHVSDSKTREVMTNRHSFV